MNQTLSHLTVSSAPSPPKKIALRLLDASESMIGVGSLISGAKIRRLVGESVGSFSFWAFVPGVQIVPCQTQPDRYGRTATKSERLSPNRRMVGGAYRRSCWVWKVQSHHGDPNSAINRSITAFVRLYSGDCFPTLSPERMRSDTASRSGSCPCDCLRVWFSALRRLTPP